MMERKIIRSVADLEVYSLSYQLAVKIFEITKSFPKEELFSLTDQVRRCSRSIPANISEGFAKRKYENVVRNQLISAMGSAEETLTWIDFAKDFKYISVKQWSELKTDYRRVGAMLYRLNQNWHSI